MTLTAVCPCGDEWAVEGGGATTDRLDARAAVMFATDRGAAVRRYNEHVANRAKHPKGY